MDHEYELIGYGPAATGSGSGWRMSATLYARCRTCQHHMRLDPSRTEVCPCGRLYKDADTGRFGSDDGDDTIAIYRSRVRSRTENAESSGP